ncbi:hypothetical protein HAX54_024143 [Datura stramonium]|uniref:Uncharacterized protein n=1 Tax=Datura stramonium TaxID=4076 RepID=A0ABS8S556_DATST|nr:hypothetical protein [Datura stramonium]
MSDVGPVYIGGNKEYAFNIDMDHLSIPEVKDYCRDFGVPNVDKMFVVVPWWKFAGIGGLNKDSTNKVGEGPNAPLGKEIELIDGRGKIEGVQTSNLTGKSNGNTNEFGLSNEEEDFDEDLDEDDVELTVHDQVEHDENIDLSGDEDGYESDIHKELNIVKVDLKAYIKRKRESRIKISEYFLGPVGIDLDL